MDFDIVFHGISKPGLVRGNNEDKFGVSIDSFNDRYGVTHNYLKAIVADGMGGHGFGEIASEIVVKEISGYLASNIGKCLTNEQFENLLKNSILHAHNRIIATVMDNSDYEGMGSTVVVILIQGNKLHYAWTGDSRIYMHNPYAEEPSPITNLPFLNLLTRDHSIVWKYLENGSVSLDNIEELDNSHIITQSIGALNNTPAPDASTITLIGNERLLLCSDGLNLHLKTDEISKCLKTDDSVEQIANNFLDLTYEKGAKDNVTAVLLEIIPLPDATIYSPNKIKEKSSFLKNFKLLGMLIFLTSFATTAYFIYVNSRSNRIGAKLISKIQPKPKSQFDTINIVNTNYMNQTLIENYEAANTDFKGNNNNKIENQILDNKVKPNESKSQAKAEKKNLIVIEKPVKKEFKNINFDEASRKLLDFQMLVEESKKSALARKDTNSYNMYCQLMNEFRPHIEAMFQKLNLVNHTDSIKVRLVVNEANKVYKNFKTQFNYIKTSN